MVRVYRALNMGSKPKARDALWEIGWFLLLILASPALRPAGVDNTLQYMFRTGSFNTSSSLHESMRSSSFGEYRPPVGDLNSSYFKEMGSGFSTEFRSRLRRLVVDLDGDFCWWTFNIPNRYSSPTTVIRSSPRMDISSNNVTRNLPFVDINNLRGYSGAVADEGSLFLDQKELDVEKLGVAIIYAAFPAFGSNMTLDYSLSYTSCRLSSPVKVIAEFLKPEDTRKLSTKRTGSNLQEFLAFFGTHITWFSIYLRHFSGRERYVPRNKWHTDLSSCIDSQIVQPPD